MGVRKAVEAPTATTIIIGRGDTPNPSAACKTIGVNKTVVAVLLIICVKAVVSKKILINNNKGW